MEHIKSFLLFNEGFCSPTTRNGNRVVRIDRCSNNNEMYPYWYKKFIGRTVEVEKDAHNGKNGECYICIKNQKGILVSDCIVISE